MRSLLIIDYHFLVNFLAWRNMHSWSHKGPQKQPDKESGLFPCIPTQWVSCPHTRNELYLHINWVVPAYQLSCPNISNELSQHIKCVVPHIKWVFSTRWWGNNMLILYIVFICFLSSVFLSFFYYYCYSHYIVDLSHVLKTEK